MCCAWESVQWGTEHLLPVAQRMAKKEGLQTGRPGHQLLHQLWSQGTQVRAEDVGKQLRRDGAETQCKREGVGV